MSTRQERGEDRVIEQIYRQHCHGMQLTMTRVPALFRMARVALRNGESHDEIGAKMVAFVKEETP